MNDPAGPPEVTVLLGLHRGAGHLPAQLGSIVAQRGVVPRLLCARDGPDDGAEAILSAFDRCLPVERIAGAGQGFAANYLSLLAALPAAPGIVALADQDDVWLPGKLARAAAMLAREERPALYCARAWLVDARLRPLRQAAGPVTSGGFPAALLRNIAPGNTIVLNPAGAALARAAARELQRQGALGLPAAHDWFLYLLFTGGGHRVLHDRARVLLYRQHGANAIGQRTGLSAASWGLRALCGGHYGSWVRANAAALSLLDARLTPSARNVLRAVTGASGEGAGLTRPALPFNLR